MDIYNPMKTRPFDIHSVLLRVNLDDITLYPPPPPHSSLNQVEVRPHQILSLGIFSGSGRQRLGSHCLAPTKCGIRLVLKFTPNPQLLRFPFQITHYLKALSPLSILNTHKLGSFQMVQLF